MMIKPQTLKGFRDFLPLEAKKRQFVINKLKDVFELYGFEPLETPTLEYEEILMGKYGEEADRLVYRFEDHGKRRIALRYDQTVPLARVIAQYQNELPMPFKRYQIQPVWRAENTQKGRFREFIQCDIDTIGTNSTFAEAEIISLLEHVYKELGFKKIKILINDRRVFEGLSPKAIGIIDKLKKIGEDGVVEELIANEIVKDVDEAKNILQSIVTQKPTAYITQVLAAVQQLQNQQDIIEFSPTLARGLDYYTGIIIEVETPEYPHGSLGGGGRYDNLIGMFAGKDIAAVGYAFGFDRIIDAMDELQLFPTELQQATTQVLVTVFDESLKETSLKTCSTLRRHHINAEIYLGTNIKMEKQFKYADQKGIPFAAIIGPEEIEKNSITLKNLRERTQRQLTLDELISFLHTDK
ncbi:MAG TPA: histidine--tRNA ligase [Candidatus Saccharimonadales bacterium]|nr:histidine--tRNA ligase [Candidatus Saccharimonadales bacterium]